MDKRLISFEEDRSPQGELSLETKVETKSKHKIDANKAKLITSILVYAVAIPLIIVMGVFLFNDRKYNLVSILIAVVSCVPFFITFEKGKTKVRELVIIAVMTTLSVLGRIIFAPVPGFKPVTAIVIITAIACGPQAGFITGALSAVVSDIFFGQGPWTPFQMCAWGFLGLLSGIVFHKTRNPNWLLLIIMGILGGAVFSFIMDVWSVFNVDGTWNWARYGALIVTSAPWIAVYCVSNVVFLLILTRPFINKLNRIKDKYELFQ